MKKLNKSGFSTVEIILVVVIIGLLSGVGWYVLKINKKATPLDENAKYAYSTNSDDIPHKVQDNKKTDDTKEPPSIGKITYVSGGTDEQIIIKKRLKSFYDAWNNLSTKVQIYTKDADSTYKTYMTDDQHKQLIKESSYNLFTCSQMKTSTLTIGNPVISSSTATVKINSTELGGIERKPLTLALIKNNSTWYLDHVTCVFE